MLTRRQFHSRLMASFATLALPLPLQAETTAVAAEDLWLNRLTFGATGDSRAAFLRLGASAWLEDQLAMPSSDPGLTDRLKTALLRISYDAGSDENGHSWKATNELRPLTALFSDPKDQLFCIDWEQGMEYSERSRPASEVIAASMIRAVHAPAQLREVMTQFWHDHFSVNSQKNEFTAAFFASHDAIMRENAFGNFRTLLGAVARSPAMGYYLNNADSRASPANENWGRELLELHTLGAGNYLNDRYEDWHSVPTDANGLATGYLDLDVYEVARAFTGWSVGDGRQTAEGTFAPLTGRFFYIDAWHDPYQKRVLGTEIPPNRAPMADGDQVLDILASHPATARFICTKLARRLLVDHPDPALIDTLSAVFLNAKDDPDQIAQIIRALVNHPSFAETPASKLRRPFEFMAAMYRATGAKITSTENAFQWQLMRAGWKQHEYGPPTGHPDTLDKWTGASSLNRLVDFALYGHDDWFGVGTADLLVRAGDDETLDGLVARWAGKLGVNPDGIAAAMGLDPNSYARELSDEDRNGIVVGSIAFAALTPQFLLR